MARGKEMMDDEARLDAALVTERPPSVGEGEGNPAALLAQFQQFMKMGIELGWLHQRPDGTMVLPGSPVSKRREIGSACTCSQCGPHNQRHWICVICGSAHEYVIERPRASWPHLGPAGVAGRLDAVCTDACAREYLQSMRAARGNSDVPGMPNVPMNGSDGELGLLMAQGLAG